MDKLSNLKFPKTSIKTLIKEIHQYAIKYMTYLVLNKKKLENEQATITPPCTKGTKNKPIQPTSQGGINPHVTTRSTVFKHLDNGLTFTPVAYTGVSFSFLAPR